MVPPLINELYDHLQLNPRNVAVLELLVKTWLDHGTAENARGHAEEIIRIDATNSVALRCLNRDQPNAPNRKVRLAKQALPSNLAVEDLGGDLRTPVAITTAETRMVREYHTLKQDSAVLAAEFKAIFSADPSQEELVDYINDLELMSIGNISEVVGQGQPRAVREVARLIQEDPDQEATIILEDFEDVVQFALAKNPPLDPDEIREKIVKRSTLLAAVLPESKATESRIAQAMTRIERQYFSRRYANTETMYGDAVEDIPQEQFFVSEDNYAWDMTELAAALKAGSGVMRNPLSRQMFSEADIQKILSHRSGQELRPMKLAQDKMKSGVRPATIDQIAHLGSVMLADQSSNMLPSHHAMDEFLAFVATLPSDEQKTLQSLRVQAKDSLNGQMYDSTIWQAVQDAKGNMTCVHKTGDYLSQAAQNLRLS